MQLDCKHKRGAKCAAQLRLPVIDGFFLLNKPYTQGEHSRLCCSMCGVDPPPEDEVVEDEDLFALPKHAENKPFVEVTHKMKMKTEELSILPGNRSMLPSMISRSTTGIGTDCKNIRSLRWRENAAANWGMETPSLPLRTLWTTAKCQTWTDRSYII